MTLLIHYVCIALLFAFGIMFIFTPGKAREFIQKTKWQYISSLGFLLLASAALLVTQKNIISALIGALKAYGGNAQ